MPFEVGRFQDSAKGDNLGQTSTQLFSDAYDRACKAVQATAREVSLVTAGALCGAADEFQKDPVGTVSRAGATFAVGAGLGALAAAESPIIATGAVAAGAIWTGAWAVETLNPLNERNQDRFSKIGTALNDVWNHGDKATFDTSLQRMREAAGPIALDVGLMAIGGRGALLGAKHIPGLKAEFSFLHGKELSPAAVPTYYNGRASESWFDANDLNLYKVRSGRAKVNLGPPETVEARLALMDKSLGISQKPTTLNQIRSDQHVQNILTPAQSKSHWQDSRWGQYYRK